MRRRSDVFAVLAWGARSYAWIVVVFMVALGFVVPAILQQAPDRYEATAQAGPTGRIRISNLDALPKVGTTVFVNVYDSPEVKQAAGLAPGEALGADEIELISPQDNVVFQVVGRASTPETAANLANTAAAVFVDEVNKYTEAIGPFGLTTLAQEPREPVVRVAGPVTWGLGLFAGLAAGLGTVALLLLLRRPVVDAVSAQEAAGAPVLARMTLNGGRVATGMAQICRRILADSVEMLLLVGPHNTSKDRYVMTEEIVAWLGRVRRVVPLRTRARDDEFGAASIAAAHETGPTSGGKDLLVIDDASPVEVATRPDKSLMLLVVREGISQGALRAYADQYLDGEDTALVLVAKPSRWRLSGRRGPASKATGVREARGAHAAGSAQSTTSATVIEDDHEAPAEETDNPRRAD